MHTSGPVKWHQQNLQITDADRDLFWGQLRASGSKALPNEVDAFVSGVQAALARHQFRSSENRRRRSAREDLRDLFMACADQNNISKIRNRFPQLPVLARDELLRRAKARHPDLNVGAVITWEGLCIWAQTCSDEDLLEKLPGLIAGGRARSYGQLRESGLNSAPHIEPLIMGEFLRLKPISEPVGAPKSRYKGGHPGDISVDALIAELALLWLEATGERDGHAARLGVRLLQLRSTVSLEVRPAMTKAIMSSSVAPGL